MAGGGIVAFAGGGEADGEYDPYDDEDNEEYYADMEHQSKLAQLIAQGEASSNALTQDMLDSPRAYAGAAGTSGIVSNYSNAGEGIKFKDPIPTSGLKATQYSGDKDQARKYNVGNLRPSGFSYPGQVGVSPGGFAMLDANTTIAPNPVRQAAIFKYSLPESGKVSIKLLSASGVIVDGLFNGWQNKGQQQLIINKKGLPPGVYHISIQSNLKQKTQTFLITN
jgi:hypothetical protein